MEPTPPPAAPASLVAAVAAVPDPGCAASVACPLAAVLALAVPALPRDAALDALHHVGIRLIAARPRAYA